MGCMLHFVTGITVWSVTILDCCGYQQEWESSGLTPIGGSGFRYWHRPLKSLVLGKECAWWHQCASSLSRRNLVEMLKGWGLEPIGNCVNNPWEMSVESAVGLCSIGISLRLEFQGTSLSLGKWGEGVGGCYPAGRVARTVRPEEWPRQWSLGFGLVGTVLIAVGLVW